MIEFELDSSRVRFVEWLDADLTLTPVELRIVRCLGQRLGTWVPAPAIVKQVYRETHEKSLTPYEIRSFRTHVYRIRRKIEPTPWRIENRFQHGLYRLIQVADA